MKWQIHVSCSYINQILSHNKDALAILRANDTYTLKLGVYHVAPVDKGKKVSLDAGVSDKYTKIHSYWGNS